MPAIGEPDDPDPAQVSACHPRVRGRGINHLGFRAAVSSVEITPELAAKALSGSFPGDLGIELTAISDDEVHGRLAVDRRHLHPGGYVHGGVWVAFADTVAAWGTMRNLRPGQDFTTTELKANVFAAGRVGDVLTARGEALHVGRRTQAWEVRIHRGQKLAALFVCTQVVLGAPPS
jgi:1,4-dihydroxy-2-naphthoyl-CoA hydrolase